MSLHNILERKVISCTPETPIKEVAELMDKENVGAILVLQKGKPQGIITDRDIVIRCVVKGLDCTGTAVKEMMTENVETVNVDDGIYDVVQVMKKNKIRRVPVIDSSGKAVGLLSFSDVYQLLAKEIGDLSVPVAPEEPKIVEQAA
ncbi:CBS domain-containing protein [Candidatus Peregrinibacteria bacterium]|nr:CBS domain-containing protein [Candidatus Peregrinibacteria bacterium]